MIELPNEKLLKILLSVNAELISCQLNTMPNQYTGVQRKYCVDYRVRYLGIDTWICADLAHKRFLVNIPEEYFRLFYLFDLHEAFNEIKLREARFR